jgi:hypothetical protein
MESPMLYMFGYVGVAQINDDMLEVLRTYLHNGGFLWMDDGTTGEGDIQWMENRMFIQKLIGRKETDEMTKQVFKRLSQDDKDVPGYNLIGNEPEPFHPWTYIYFNLPEQSRVYIRIFNKLGIPVRDFDLGELLSGAYADKKTGLKWDCKDQKGEDVGSGSYFFQMEAGLFKKTKQFTVSDLRMLDKSHPLYSSFYRMDKVPIGYTPIGPRPYGNETFGYFIGDHLAIVYNEGNEVIAGTADTKDAAQKEACSKWMTNIIVFAVTQPTGIVSRR